MKKSFKKFIFTLLAVVMVFGAAPLAGFVGLNLPETNFLNIKAEATVSGVCGDNLEWIFNEDTGELKIAGTGKMYDYNSSYSSPWYSSRNYVKSVVIGKGVTNIGSYAFRNCINLIQVSVAESVTSIGDCAFTNCKKLVEFTIPNSVTYVGEYSFENCLQLTEIIIPESVTQLGYCAFSGCTKLNSISISDNVSHFGGNVFYNTQYFNNKDNWENCVLYVGNHLVNTNSNLSGSYTIKDNIKTIADLAFTFCYEITDITISDSVKSIGNNAFSHCNKLSNIVIPDSVETIGDYAFNGCDLLSSVEMSDNVRTIGQRAFYGCYELSQIYLPCSIKRIGDSAFDECNIRVTFYEGTPAQWETIDVGEDNDNIITGMIFESNSERAYYTPGVCGENLTWTLFIDGELLITGSGNMFDYTYSSSSPWHYDFRNKIKSIVIDDGVTSIGNFAFDDCTELTIVSVANSVARVGDYAFNNCTNLYEIILPENVDKIGSWAFNGCEMLSEFTIPNNVTEIYSGTFSSCKNLNRMTIHKGVQKIDSYAFYNCLSLSDIYYEGSEKDWNALEINKNQNDDLINANIHFKIKSLDLKINAYANIDGSVALSKQFGITLSSDDKNAPLPEFTHSVIDNFGCVSFPVLITEEDLQGLESKSFRYILTISSADGKKYDFSPKTQQVEITVNNSNGNLSCIGLEDCYKFNGYSYKYLSFILTWDDGDDCCKVRPESLDLSLVSDRSDEKVPFTISLDSKWRATVNVREVDDAFNYHKYSVEGLDCLKQIGYNIYLDESDDGEKIYTTASLPYFRVGFYTTNGSSPANQYVVRNSTVSEPEAPTSEYYNFVGWYKDENCTDSKEWNFETDVVTQNTVLYAKWEPKPIEITLKTEHGVLQDGENSKELTITIPACSAIGIKLSEEIYDSNYNHIGWVDEDGNVITATTKLYEDTILYAVWQKKPYYDSTISIRNNNGSKTINYGETLKLTVNTTNMPDGSKIYWYVDGVKKGEGDFFEVSFDSGSKIISAKLIGTDGNVLKDVNGNEISDTETVTVKSGFFQKLISFFKNLFGINRTVVQAIFEGVF